MTAAVPRRRNVYIAALVLVVLVWHSGGCNLPARLVWSPDGKHAVYVKDFNAYLLDERGSVREALGVTTGGVAWSSDSTTLFAALVVDPVTRLPLGSRQLQEKLDADPAAGAAAQPPQDGPGLVCAVFAVRDGNKSIVCQFEDESVSHLVVSPGDAWLALALTRDLGDDERRVHVCRLRDRAVRELSGGVGIGMAFTGAERLAYVPRTPDAKPGARPQLVEVQLPAEGRIDPLRRRLASLPSSTGWIEAGSDELLFTAVPRGGASADEYALFRLGRRERNERDERDEPEEPTILARGLGPFFASSPNRQRVLVEVRGKDGDEQRSSLAVLDRASGQVHVLREWVGKGPIPPMWPAWRDDEHITFVSEGFERIRGGGSSGGSSGIGSGSGGSGGRDRLVYEVVLYQLTPDWLLKPVRTLSKTWDRAVKPHIDHGGKCPAPSAGAGAGACAAHRGAARRGAAHRGAAHRGAAQPVSRTIPAR